MPPESRVKEQVLFPKDGACPVGPGTDGLYVPGELWGWETLRARRWKYLRARPGITSQTIPTTWAHAKREPFCHTRRKQENARPVKWPRRGFYLYVPQTGVFPFRFQRPKVKPFFLPNWRKQCDGHRRRTPAN